ncbi:hemolysin family protein [Lysobacter niastensis]|uniref:HlyC/CorC family transporter n=1 Tax=Lysobacter niastensis TaxID=380629 RepID=A0ABS0B2X5_9GAMM|nr:hemolysin family protein [Lysobacter niastensis]MBF6022834.1 HlyC/CorC family transporter [Lysobacter niastensis]
MLELLIVLALIVLNAFFALSEMALMTSRKLRLKQMAETSRGARVALELAEHPDNLLSTVQVGITSIGILTGTFGGESIGLVIAGWLQGMWPDATQYARAIGLGTAVSLITAASVIFGELIPKRLALTNAERIASAVALPLYWLSRAARPIVAALGAINRAVLRVLGIKDDARSAISEEEIRLLVTESHEQGVIDADERKMMNRVLGLGDRSAESLMTPRMRIAWLDAAADFAENLAAMRETPFSRYPVYRGDDSDVLGILEVKSLLDRLDEKAPDLFKELREPLFVSESTHAMKLLEIFREEQQSLALVVDEYGEISGIVTIADLMDAVVGRIHTVVGQAGKHLSPEEEDSAGPVVERADGSYLLDGALPIEDLRELVGGGALPDEEQHDFHTAAGMVIAHFGRIPYVGEFFDWGTWRIEVVDLDGPRIDKLLLNKRVEPDTDEHEASG